MESKYKTDNGAIGDILVQIHDERIRQDRKFGDQSDKGPSKWFAILGEEFGEVAKEHCEIIHGGGDRENLREELIQTAASAAAWVQFGDANGWWTAE